MISKKEKLGIALVGLGEYATNLLIPAFQETKRCYLAGLVSGDPETDTEWKEKLSLEDNAIFSYENFDQIAKNKEIDIVYITLPNSMHAEYAMRAMKAGKHVICEKPITVTVADGEAILKVMKDTGKYFSMGYRLHYDPYHKFLMYLGQKEVFGPVKRLFIENSMVMPVDDPWHIKPELAGGGPLMNNGIYCIQAAIYVTGQLPVAVEARFAPRTTPHLAEIEEGVGWTMYFDQGLEAVCETSYVKNQDKLRAETDAGWFELAPAFGYGDIKGATHNGEIQFEPVNQQALQMDDFATCILAGTGSGVPAEMGLRDLKIITAIYESARKKTRIRLGSL